MTNGLFKAAEGKRQSTIKWGGGCRPLCRFPNVLGLPILKTSATLTYFWFVTTNSEVFCNCNKQVFWAMGGTEGNSDPTHPLGEWHSPPPPGLTWSRSVKAEWMFLSWFNLIWTFKASGCVSFLSQKPQHYWQISLLLLLAKVKFHICRLGTLKVPLEVFA